MGIGNPREIAWLDPPPEAAVAHAEALLERLGATGEKARRMARYPLHPRLARLVMEALDRGAGEEGCMAAALLSAGARSESCDLFRLLDFELEPRAKQHFQQIRSTGRPPNYTRTDPHPLP